MNNRERGGCRSGKDGNNLLGWGVTKKVADCRKTRRACGALSTIGYLMINHHPGTRAVYRDFSLRKGIKRSDGNNE